MVLDSIKKIDVTATGSLEVVAHVKWNGHLTQIVFQNDWKIYHGGVFPMQILIETREEIQKRVEKIILEI